MWSRWLFRYHKTCVSSMIPLARLTVRPGVITILTWNSFCVSRIRKMGTNGRTDTRCENNNHYRVNYVNYLSICKKWWIFVTVLAVWIGLLEKIIFLSLCEYHRLSWRIVIIFMNNVWIFKNSIQNFTFCKKQHFFLDQIILDMGLGQVKLPVFRMGCFCLGLSCDTPLVGYIIAHSTDFVICQM